MAGVLPHFIFTLKRLDRGSQSMRVVGAVLVALESPVYVGRLVAGSENVEDLSRLIITGQMTDRLIDGLQAISQHPGADVGREHGELFTLFDDPAMTERGTRAAFVRQGTYTSFVRRTDRYERILRTFMAEQRT